MSWNQSVYSSHVRSIGWDEDTNEMTVTWDNGRVSAYAGVDESTAIAVANAPSVGEMLHQTIKPNYKHRYIR